MGKKKTKNSVDNTFELLVQEFLQVPNIERINEDEAYARIVSFITFRFLDLASYKNLVLQQFIPATNKAIVQTKNDYKTSQYKNLLNLGDDDFKEPLYETIRLAYIGLFHKFENYLVAP